MRYVKGLFIGLALMSIAVAVDLSCEKGKAKEGSLYSIRSPEDIVALMPATPKELEQAVEKALESAKISLEAIIAIPHEQRTYENTAKALDALSSRSDFSVMASLSGILEMVSPDEAMRKAAHEAVQKIDEFIVDYLTSNVVLYQAFKEYAQGNALNESLNAEQRYFITETMRDFERAGLNLPAEQRAKIAQLKKELAKLSQDFELNIASDAKKITVSRPALQGLDDDFINALSRAENGDYILGTDYPTYFNVIENCSVADTRKQMNILFSNRGYPANDVILKAVIAKRDELAKLLGFASYAELNLDNSMVGTVERAQAFLDDLLVRCKPKVLKEVELLTKELPEGVSLTHDKKMNPWDVAYVKASYKKKHFSIDEREIAEYFPMEKTVQGLLDIYREFLGVDFKAQPIKGLWHEDVSLIEVINKDDGSSLGYLLLDLYPRPFKFNHACHAGLIPAVYADDGTSPASLSLVIANFAKSTATKPSLLKRDEVRTFFHEFGHALHSKLGRTQVASFAGTSVKRDFVEMPSQMLEEWLWDTHILKKISSHYKTSQPLSDDLIAKIQGIKNLDSGDWAQRQAYLSKLSLSYFAPGAQKDPNAIMHTLQQQIRTHIAGNDQDHFYAAFGHLMGYGAQYYGYLWSKVYALDLFAQIKQSGLLNPQIGKRYVRDVIGKGGSDDPNVLLETFLGRAPTSHAFFEDLGL